MVKIILYPIFTLSVAFCLSCSSNTERQKSFQDLENDHYNLVFGSLFSDIEYNFQSDSIRAGSLNRIVFKDTLSMSKMDKDKIASMFYKNRIFANPFYENTEHVSITGDVYVNPPSSDKIRVYHNNKLIVTIEINTKYENNSFFSDKNERQIVEFRNYVWAILNKQKKYRAAGNALVKENRQNRNFHL